MRGGGRGEGGGLLHLILIGSVLSTTRSPLIGVLRIASQRGVTTYCKVSKEPGSITLIRDCSKSIVRKAFLLIKPEATLKKNFFFFFLSV